MQFIIICEVQLCYTGVQPQKCLLHTRTYALTTNAKFQILTTGCNYLKLNRRLDTAGYNG